MEEFWQDEEVSKRYERLAIVGEGGAGTVFKARDVVLDKVLVIKVLKTSFDSKQLRRFQREAVVSGRLRHPNIVEVYDFALASKNQPYMVSEFLDGYDFDEYLERNELSDLDKIEMFIQICSGLAYAHKNGVVHRDVKPGNVLVREQGSVPLCKLGDFGLARMTELSSDTPVSKGTGSPLYMSPEQFFGDDVTERADVYSLGCLMYHGLTGNPPFAGETNLELAMQHKAAEPPTLSSSTGMIYPESIEMILRKCLQKKPEARYPSALELLAELQEAHGKLVLNQLDHAVPDILPEQIGKSPAWEQNNRRSFNPAVLYIVLCALIIGLPTVILLQPKHITNNSSFRDELGPMPLQCHFRESPSLDKNCRGPKIESLNLDSESELSTLNKYKEISHLNLHRDEISGEGLALVKCPIDLLVLDTCPITLSGCKAISGVKGLAQLSVQNCKIEPGMFKWFAKIPTLRVFCYGTKGQDPRLIDELQENKSIDSWQIYNMRIDDHTIKSLAKMRKMNALCLSACDITDSACQEISRLRPIKAVAVANTNVAVHEARQLLKIPTKDLELVSLTLTRDALMSLSGSSKIGKLTFYCDQASDGDVAAVKKTLRNAKAVVKLSKSKHKVPDDLR